MGTPEALRMAVQRGLGYALEARLAPHYERHLIEECHYQTHDILARELGALAPPPGLFVDLGAGTGLVGKAMVARGMALDLVAVDISGPMLDLIEGSIYVAKHIVDCTKTPFADASFEGAVAAGLLEHIVEPSAVFREVARIVKPGGLFLFSFAKNHVGRTELFDAEQGLVSHDAQRLAASLAEAGLKVQKEADHPAYLNGSLGVTSHRVVVAIRTL